MYTVKIPGHSFLLQACDWLDIPTQSLPPYTGFGLEQYLSLICAPPPHVAVHEDEGPHPLQRPFTV